MRRCTPPDRAQRDHRASDQGEGHAGIRLGVPARARSLDDAQAGRTASRHPAARYRREHLARHHRDLHACAGALFRTCRSGGGRSRRCAIPRASISASRCRSCRISAPPARSRRWRHRRAIWRWCRPHRSRGSGAWWAALEGDKAPKIIARLPFVERPDHPAALPVFVVSAPGGRRGRGRGRGLAAFGCRAGAPPPRARSPRSPR